MFNIIAIDSAACITILTSKKILGNNAAKLTFILLLPLVIFSPHMIVPYTDTITMLFPILIFYLYLKIKEKSKYYYLWRFLEGTITVIGILLKPTVIIVWIAIFIIELFSFKKKKIQKKNIISFVNSFLLVVLGAGIIYIGFCYLKDKNINDKISKENFEEKSFSMSHFLMMGMQQEPYIGEIDGKNNILYGAYNEKDVQNTGKIKGSKEKLRI